MINVRMLSILFATIAGAYSVKEVTYTAANDPRAQPKRERDTNHLREIAEHNAAVDQRNAEKKARRAARGGKEGGNGVRT